MRTHDMTLDLPARLTMKQAAEAFGLSDRTIRRWIADGLIVAYRVGPRFIRIDRDSLLALEKRMGGGAA